MTDTKSAKDHNTKKTHKKSRKITIYGLISFYGTERAKKCATYLHKTLPHLYKKPIIRKFYDYEWVDVVKELQIGHGSKHRRIKYLNHPVIVFFNDRYVGDHRAIIHYVIVEHKILPDLPYPDLFPDFTDLLPKCNYKDYVYFDVRVGDMDDYVIGKMVFELHSDLVPETSNFFADLCKPFHERVYGTTEQRWKYSYLGSTIHRICGNSFIQGGRIVGCSLQVKGENFAVKHVNRGVLSLCNERGNNSTSEFCISLKENKWLDNRLVAFGQLIFGEPILTAIQEVPTYYQRPLKEIIIVGCGVIPKLEERVDRFRAKIIKQQEWINLDVEELRKKRIEDVKKFEEKVKSFLESSEIEKNVEYAYSEDVTTDVLGELTGEETTVREDEEKPKLVTGDFTLKTVLKKHREKHEVEFTKIMSKLIGTIVENMNYAESSDQTEPLDYIPKKVIKDAVDIREVPSDQLLEARFESGLYSIPESLRKLLVKAFERLTPSQLKMIGMESRDILKKAGIPDSTASLVGSENVMSGLVMAVADVAAVKEQGGLGFAASVHDIFSEICEDAVELLIQRGPEGMRNMLGNCTQEIMDDSPSEENVGSEQ